MSPSMLYLKFFFCFLGLTSVTSDESFLSVLRCPSLLVVGDTSPAVDTVVSFSSVCAHVRGGVWCDLVSNDPTITPVCLELFACVIV